MSTTLIINVGGSGCYQGLDTAIEPPYWSIMLGSYLEKIGEKVHILDLNCEEYFTAEEERGIAGWYDKFIVLAHGHNPSASTPLMDRAFEIGRDLGRYMRPGQYVYIGGGHVEKNHITKKDSLGDGYLPLAEGGVLQEWGKNDYGSIYQQELNWDLVDMRRYRAHNWHCLGGLDRGGYGVVHTSFGCPFNCEYCCVGGKGMSFRSPEIVLKDIDGLVSRGVKNLKIADEIFFFRKSHYMPILEGLVERGYGLNIWCYARPDMLDYDVLELAKKAGINWLALGIEGTRDGKCGKDIGTVVKTIQDSGINVIGNYMFGLVGDTFESMEATLDLALELNCEYANFYCVMAYPGSRLYEKELAKSSRANLPLTWSGYGQYSADSTPLPTESLSSADILLFRDNAFHEYFNSPKYLDMIRMKFGENTMNEIKRMTGTRLRRADGVV